MGKSITATLIGLLVQDGAYDLDEPAPVPGMAQARRSARDAIRIADLLRMSSGLRFIGAAGSGLRPRTRLPRPSLRLHRRDRRVPLVAITRPPQLPPNTDGRYRNSDPLTIGLPDQEGGPKRGEEYLT